MNDKNKMSSAIFTPSGCLTGDALLQLVSGLLKGKTLLQAQNHIEECPLCADAAEGLKMWLNENKSLPADTEKSVYATESGQTNASDDQPFASQAKTETNEPIPALFRKRTDVINEHIRKRLYAHGRIEAAEKKHISYQPFVWLSAAATLLLFIVIGYVLWLQNQLYTQTLAKERADQILMLEGTSNQDTLTVSMMEKQGIPGHTNNVEKRSQRPALVVADIIISDDVISQDKRSVTLQASEFPETPPEREAAGANGEAKISGSDKVHPSSGGTYSIAVTEKTEIEDETRPVFAIVEQMPSFPGGEEKRIAFLARNIRYPEKAIENAIQGKVYVSFVVKRNGNLADFKVLQGIGSGCDEEVLRVVKMMPKWSPGKQDGKAVDVLYNMAVIFKLKN